MELKITKYDNAPEYGTWGEWTLGKEHGTFGRSMKGMWAQMDGCRYIGVETCENDVTSVFKYAIIRWRNLNNAFKKVADFISEPEKSSRKHKNNSI